MKKLLIVLAAALLLAVSCTPADIKTGSSANGAENSGNTVNGEAPENTENKDAADSGKNGTGGSFDENKEDAVNGNVNTDKTNGSEDSSQESSGKENNGSEPDNTPKNTVAAEFSDDRWIIKPSYAYDSLETFGMTGYSIYRIGEEYGILDMTAGGIGTGDYSELFYCPTHGLSCPDILEVPIQMRDDLYLAPDCGYEYDPQSEVTYVFDPTRDRVYATGYSDGYFKIVDITDTEFYGTNERYTVVLYDCDADLMMYEGIGMPSLEAVFEAESKEMHYGVIDKDMDYVIACIYEEIRDGNDCYIVKENGKYGYRAVTGREYYPCVFEAANTAYKGAAWVKYGGLWGTVRF